MTKPTTGKQPTKILRFRVPDELHLRLRTYAATHDLSVAAAVRRLVQAGIRQHDAEDRLLTMVLATLVACEQTLLLLESFLPEGKVRSARLEEPAIRAAQLRLAQVAMTGDDA
jgi:plasmid stability protein